MKLRPITLLDFNGKYSLKNKLHIYNLVNQEALINNILERFPSLKKKLSNFRSYQDLVTLRFGNYNFRKTYLKWIYNHFSDSIPNRRQIHQNEAVSLIKWAKHFNQNSRHLKFLTIGIISNDRSLKAYLRVSGLSLVNNSISLKIGDAIRAEYPKNDFSSFYQFEKIVGNQIINSLQTSFKQCILGFPFTLINETPNSKIINTLKPSLKPKHHIRIQFNDNVPSFVVNSISDPQLNNPSESNYSNVNTSEVSVSKALYYDHVKSVKSSMLVSKASSASSSLVRSTIRSKSTQAKSQRFVSMNIGASNSAAQSKASLQASNVNRSMSVSAFKMFQMLKSQFQSLERINKISDERSHIDSSYEPQSIKFKSSSVSSNSSKPKSSKMFQIIQSSSSSRNLKINNLPALYSDKSVPSSNESKFKGHIKWKVKRLRRHKVASVVWVALIIIIIGILLFESQKNGIIN